jgi:hypothetical protein
MTTLHHLIRHGIAFLLLSYVLILMVLKEITLVVLEVDNIPHRQASDTDDSRTLRFPSVEDRVKLYMSNWYVPPCPGSFIQVNHTDASSLTIHEVTSKEQAADNQEGRTLLFKSEIAMDNIFFVNRHTPWNCTQHTRMIVRSYCQDVQSTLLPTLERVNDDAMTPVFLQFGDTKHSGKIYGSVNIPHIRKIRSVATQASLSNVTVNRCYNGPRDPLHTKHDKQHFQPILWKLNAARHYGMLSQVQQNDIPWSLKKNMTVFRGALTGFTRDGYKQNTTAFDNCMIIRRCRLVLRHDKSNLVDARLIQTNGVLPDILDGTKLTGQVLSTEQQLHYKAIIMLEGNDVASGLKWVLLSNSVVMMQPPSYTSWAMEELLEPWVHYIPLNEELSDVEEKMQWVLDHDDHAQQIAERGTLWIQDLVLHSDAVNDDKQIEEEIIRRYRAHFVVDDE